MFTVRDAENAMITFTILATAVAVGIFLHELLIDRIGFVKSLYAVAGNVSNILSAATLLTLLDEGVDIMFLRRTREERRKNREEDYKQALQEVSEWNTRRLEAEARGKPFTEPMPGHDLPKRKKRRFLFF